MSATITAVTVEGWQKKAVSGCLMLAALAWFFVGEMKEPVEKQPWSARLPTTEMLEGTSAVIAQATSRPLFSPTRKPQASVSGKDDSGIQVEPAQQSSLAFVAVIVDGANQYAILKSDQTGTHRLRTGDKFDGWVIESIERNQVLLVSGAETLALKPPEKPSFSMVENKSIPEGEERVLSKDETGRADPSQVNGADNKGRRRHRDRGNAEQPAINQEDMSRALEALRQSPPVNQEI